MKRRILIIKESFKGKMEEIKEELKSQNVPVESSVDEVCLIYIGEIEDEELDAIKRNPFIEDIEDEDAPSTS